MLEKRKRKVADASRRINRDLEMKDHENTPLVDHEVFRKHFESQFEPLPESHAATASLEGAEAESEPSERESEWDGLSEPESGDEEQDAVQVVEHRKDQDPAEDSELQRLQYKKFMVSAPVWCGLTFGVWIDSSSQSSRPPNESDRPVSNLSTQRGEGEDYSEALNLKHDLDLQRLLRESHLLNRATASSSPGTLRHKAVDMRMQSLGSKASVFHQERMPLAHRRGILAKATAREVGRRKEARENGIILEKASGRSKAAERRERAVDVPAIGKFRGGTLKLSKKDVFEIQGAARSRAGGKARRR